MQVLALRWANKAMYTYSARSSISVPYEMERCSLFVRSRSGKCKTISPTNYE